MNFVEFASSSDSPLPQQLWLAALFLRKFVVGTVAVGLFLGAIYFLYYLIRLSRLPTDDREFISHKQHLEAEALLRYVIVSVSIFLLNVLFYRYFQFGKESIHVGMVVWACYGTFRTVKSLIFSQKSVKKDA